ncbi:MAG: rRNA maturation RNase YbeY [Moraxellaceae bacterium]|nr:rRNA maturation RNase YbeY [Moraxellaceae bacterium]
MTTINLNINHSAQIANDLIIQYYNKVDLSRVADTSLTFMLAQLAQSSELDFPYFVNLTQENWQKPLELDIYVTDPIEGQQLNFEARQKNYATNILSYPSDLPPEVMQVLPNIILGELVICHEVVEKQAKEQDKSVKQHLTHLLVHGILHLLGFDHELGEDERIQMENFEIAILSKLGVNNPYE